MKPLKSAVLAAAGCAALLAGQASAEITAAQIDRLIAAKGLTVLDRQPDTIVVVAPTGDQIAIGLIDELGDGTNSVLAFLGIYENSMSVLPAQFNQWNTLATYKGFAIGDKAGVMQVNIAVGGLSDATMNAAWDMFLAETMNFRSFLYGQATVNSVSLNGVSRADPRLIVDAGLSREAIAERDAELTRHLNAAPTEVENTMLSGLTLTQTQLKLLSDESPLGTNKK